MIRPLALLLLLAPPPAQAQGFGLSFGPGIEATDVTPAMLEPGRWQLAATPRTLLAAARATATEGLADALMTIECWDGRGGPEIRVWLAYWLPGTSGPGDQYLLDLFNSVRSGRPASYDLGAGAVPTTGVSFPMNEPPPPAYAAASRTFLAGLAALPETATVTVRFASPDPARADLPVAGIAPVLAALASNGSCPPL